MDFNRVLLSCFGAVFLLFGFVGMAAPEYIGSQLKYVIEFPAAKMEFMATYGGLFLGVGGFMLYCLKSNVATGLISVAFTMGGMFCARMMGYGLYGDASSLQIFYAVAELLSLIVVLVVLKRQRINDSLNS